MRKEQFYEITSYIADLIVNSEFQEHVYAVGGSVRDLLMGNDIKDIDLVIDLPDGGVKLANYFKKMGVCSNVVIYPTYGTAMFRFNEYPDEEIECVMTRGEKYTDKDSRNPVCVFDTIEADAIRRDLTINAIYYNVSTRQIYDPTGGANDIKMKNPVKVTNENPDIVFDDDPLRILRVVRFATRFDLPIDVLTWKSMVKFVDRLDIISKERIQAEFNKILLDKNATRGIEVLCVTGAMKYIIPEFLKTIGQTVNGYYNPDLYTHSMLSLGYYHNSSVFKNKQSDLVIALSCLLHDIGKIDYDKDKDGNKVFSNHENKGATLIKTILKRLRYDNDTIKEVEFLIKNHMRTKDFGDDISKATRNDFNKLAYDCGREERWERLAILCECNNMSHITKIRGQHLAMMSSLSKAKKMFDYKLPIDGNDIMEYLNIKPGKEVKAILDYLLELAFKNPDIDRETCLMEISSKNLDVSKN